MCSLDNIGGTKGRCGEVWISYKWRMEAGFEREKLLLQSYIHLPVGTLVAMMLELNRYGYFELSQQFCAG